MSNGTNPESQGQNDQNPEQELTYDQLVAEMEKGASPDLDALMSGTPAPAPEPEVNVPDPASPNEEDDKTPKQGEPAKAGEPTPEAAAAASPAKTDAETIADLQRELHRTRSDAGRVPHIQRRMQELERELRANKARPPASTSVDADPSSIEIPAALKKKYDVIRETDPDLADTLEETFRMQTAMVHTAQETAVHTVTQDQQEREDREFFMAEKSKLLQAVPQADAVFALPEWKAWKESLTPGRKAIASSGYAEEMVQAIHAFSVDYQAAKGQPLFQQPATQAAPVATPVVPPEDNAVKAERDRKLATSASATTAAAKATEQFDEKKYFEEMYAKLGKDQGIIKTP